jgi:3-dehydroquinate synthase
MAKSMEKITVSLQKEVDDSYDIHFGHDYFEDIAKNLAKKKLADRFVLISDSNVMKKYGNDLTEVLRDHGLKVDRIGFPVGEKSKSRKMKNFIEEHMFGMGLGRDTCVIACGGGVTGDLAGFTAATYLRGVPWIQVPTSLLAMVDASIGGKTAIDVPEGKNLVGAFHQPKAVYIDTATLKTLPRRHLISGMAEVVKHGMIKSSKFLKLIENRSEAMLDGDHDAQMQIIKHSCEIKAEVVSKDEKENNLRKILNYGHTLGHSFEAISEYSLMHGEAISLGMAAEGALAVYLEMLDSNDLERQNALLKKIGLPVKAKVVLKAMIGRPLSPKEVIDYTHTDKKARKGIVEYVLPQKIGKMKTTGKKTGTSVDDKTALSFLKKELS